MQIGSEQLFASKEKMDLAKLSTYQNRDYKKMDENKMKAVSQEFESLFINQLFKSMRNTVPKDEWLNGGLKQDIFEDMLYDEYSKNISKKGGIGLGDMVYRYLKNTRS
jgi:peptidoglycan hydrolase FlgJ